MASKYILSRDQFLINESGNSNQLFNFLNEVGPELMEMLDKIKPVLPESVSDEFIEKSQRYSAELDRIGFADEAKLEHVLYSMGTSGVTLFEESNFQIENVVNHYYSLNEGVIDILKGIWNALTDNGSPSGIAHLLLDIIGLVDIPIPVAPPLTVGMIADGLNAIWYLFEGQYGSAIISAVAAAIPFAGDLAKGLKLSKGFKKINKLAETAFKTGKADKEALKILSKEDPAALERFIEIASQAKPIVSFFAELSKAVGRIIETIMRTWPMSMLFGGLGKRLGKWLDGAVEPITKNLDSALNDISAITKNSDEINLAVKAGDASKITGDIADVLKNVGKDLETARAAGNVTRVKELEQILQTTVEKGLPGAGQFVKNGRLIDVAASNIKITDDLLKKSGKEIDKALEEGWSKYADAWTEVHRALGEGVSPADLRKLEELKGLWIEQRKAEILASGLKKLDEVPAEELVKILGNSAETAASGSNFSAKLIADISDDPAKMSKFFNGIVANPKTLAKLEELGPETVALYRMFAKNPAVVKDIATTGLKAVEHFEKLAATAGKWTRAVHASRLNRNRLIIAKYLIGAPLQCPIASLGQGNMGGIDALAAWSPTVKMGESSKFILSRNRFLFEDEAQPKEAPTVSAKLDSEIKELKTKNPRVLGPGSYVDICQSHVAKVIDDLSTTATFPPKDSSLVKSNNRVTDAGSANDVNVQNQKSVENVLKQMGVPAPISDAGMMTTIPNNASVYDVVHERIYQDMTYGGLWYLLAAVMTGDKQYDEVKGSIKSLLKEYAAKYKDVQGNRISTNAISFYPSPGEVAVIQGELDQLDNDPNYKPWFFGGVSSTDIIKMF